MTRVIVRVAGNPRESPGEEDIFLSLQDPPWDIENPEQLRPFTLERRQLLEQFNEDPPSGENVREVGEMLLSRLGQHPAVADAVHNALQIPPDQSCPLYVNLIGSETAAEFPWETLYDPGNGFLALEGRWPIARIAAQVPRDKGLRTFTPPLKIMAVMSAVGVPADLEWAALREAIDASGISLDLELSLWLGERDLARQIEADMRDAGLSGSVTMLSSAEQMTAGLKRFDPHILHFFCHGSGGDSPRLQLATRRDHVRGHGSSIVLESLQLRNFGRGTWIVTLNCCEGASDADGVRSIAYLLIAAGYPATVGMREPVSSANAAVFTRAFYSSMLAELDAQLVPGEEVELEFAVSLITPRRELRDLYRQATPNEAASRHRGWTLPVLYMRPDPLRIKRVKSNPAHSAADRRATTGYVNTLLKYKLEAPHDTPADIMAAIDAEILRALEKLERAEE